MSIRHMLVIDPQNDFCDLPTTYWAPDPGAGPKALNQPGLPVQGAHADMQRLAAFIRAQASNIDAITVTLDSHQGVSIERPAMWMHADGKALEPFTPIQAIDVQQGRYVVRNPEYAQRVLAYLQALEAQGRFTHMVWPPHCEIGTWGHQVHSDVLHAYRYWEQVSMQPVTKIIKGSNPFTEHYSAIVAEVPDNSDPASQLNQALLDSLDEADQVIVGGEAASHCVRCTLEHILQYGRHGDLSRYVLLEDCVSVIKGFEQAYQEFLAFAQRNGLRVSRTTAVFDQS